MTGSGTVVWAPDPFKTGGNPRPWLVVSRGLPYGAEESVAVALSTQSHHDGTVEIPPEAWVRGRPETPSYVLPWSVATLKDDLHVVGRQGSVSDEFTGRIARELASYLDTDGGE
jgi:hypothetical protein